MTLNHTTTIADLPAVGAAYGQGIFAGIITDKNGTHNAIILLPERGCDLTWAKAMRWAKSQGGELPTRIVAALLTLNLKTEFFRGWYWTSETNSSYAWHFYPCDGDQCPYDKDYEGDAAAICLLPITA